VVRISLGIVVHVFKEVMGSEVFSRALRDMLMLSHFSNKVLNLLAKEHYKQPQNERNREKEMHEQRMKEIMEAPQLSAVEKRKLYSDQLNRFLVFKNKMAHSSPEIPAQSIAQAAAAMPQPNKSVEIPSPVPATPKLNFLTPPPTEEERPKLKRNFSTIG
jgi:hypothetical protein